MFTLSEIAFYTCLTLHMGTLFLQLISDGNKPHILVPRNIQLVTIGGIAVFTFLPVLRVILAVICGLILTMGWGSHAASVVDGRGFITHSLHALSLSVWIGILIVVAWFSKGNANWLCFLAWFHPIAMICSGVTLATGIILTLFIAPEYVNAVILPYGQALLIKHLLFLPLLLFGFVSGFLLKKRVKAQPDFSPVFWLRAESVFVLGIFAATGYMGQLEPPHDVATSLQMTNTSPLFTLLYQGQMIGNPDLSLTVTPIGLLLTVVTILFGSLILFSYVRKMSTLFSVGMGLLLAISGYFALMMSIQ
ncbi:CopD family protein [Brevibacillus fortis]|uniref:copper resistance D family protein n=1 Tax=Brevibacillus fortis TaxID=2126352 RepID=UPI002E1F0870|nr:CopD family protein [Brevibacillus fortis]